MIVSWNWLKDYVQLDMSPEELENRLTMSGLNHEGTKRVADDLAIDLEVTSNRPDCLGHIGVAREVAVMPCCRMQIRSTPTYSKRSDTIRMKCPALRSAWVSSGSACGNTASPTSARCMRTT